MSWRRFGVLLRCLSPNSATVARLQADQYIGGRDSSVKVVSGAKAAQAAFVASFGPPPEKA